MKIFEISAFIAGNKHKFEIQCSPEHVNAMTALQIQQRIIGLSVPIKGRMETASDLQRAYAIWEEFSESQQIRNIITTQIAREHKEIISYKVARIKRGAEMTLHVVVITVDISVLVGSHGTLTVPLGLSIAKSTIALIRDFHAAFKSIESLEYSILIGLSVHLKSQQGFLQSQADRIHLIHIETQSKRARAYAQLFKLRMRLNETEEAIEGEVQHSAHHFKRLRKHLPMVKAKVHQVGDFSSGLARGIGLPNTSIEEIKEDVESHANEITKLRISIVHMNDLFAADAEDGLGGKIKSRVAHTFGARIEERLDKKEQWLSHADEFHKEVETMVHDLGDTSGAERWGHRFGKALDLATSLSLVAADITTLKDVAKLLEPLGEAALEKVIEGT